MTDDPDKPKLSVVSARTQRQVETEFAQQRFNQAIIELAANVIRIVRGAGKPYQLITHCAEVVNLAVAFDEVAGRFPSDHSISVTLDPPSDPIDYRNDYWATRQIAHRNMISGALQVAASKLVGQSLQERSGENQMEKAFEAMIRAVEDLKKKRASEARSSRPKPAAKTKAAKLKRVRSKMSKGS